MREKIRVLLCSWLLLWRNRMPTDTTRALHTSRPRDTQNKLDPTLFFNFFCRSLFFAAKIKDSFAMQLQQQSSERPLRVAILGCGMMGQGTRIDGINKCSFVIYQLSFHLSFETSATFHQQSTSHTSKNTQILTSSSYVIQRSRLRILPYP